MVASPLDLAKLLSVSTSATVKISSWVSFQRWCIHAHHQNCKSGRDTSLAAGGDVLRSRGPYLHKRDIAVSIISRRPALCSPALELCTVCKRLTFCAVDGHGVRLDAVQPDFVLLQRRCIGASGRIRVEVYCRSIIAGGQALLVQMRVL